MVGAKKEEHQPRLNSQTTEPAERNMGGMSRPILPCKYPRCTEPCYVLDDGSTFDYCSKGCAYRAGAYKGSIRAIKMQAPRIRREGCGKRGPAGKKKARMIEKSYTYVVCPKTGRARMIKDSGCSSHMVTVGFLGRTRETVLDPGTEQVANVEFSTADPNGASMVPLCKGNITLVMIAKDESAWVVTLIDVYVFSDEELGNQSFLSPVALQKSWADAKGHEMKAVSGNAENSELLASWPDREHALMQGMRHPNSSTKLAFDEFGKRISIHEGGIRSFLEDDTYIIHVMQIESLIEYAATVGVCGHKKKDSSQRAGMASEDGCLKHSGIYGDVERGLKVLESRASKTIPNKEEFMRKFESDGRNREIKRTGPVYVKDEGQCDRHNTEEGKMGAARSGMIEISNIEYAQQECDNAVNTSEPCPQPGQALYLIHTSALKEEEHARRTYNDDETSRAMKAKMGTTLNEGWAHRIVRTRKVRIA